MSDGSCNYVAATNSVTSVAVLFCGLQLQRNLDWGSGVGLLVVDELRFDSRWHHGDWHGLI